MLHFYHWAAALSCIYLGGLVINEFGITIDLEEFGNALNRSGIMFWYKEPSFKIQTHMIADIKRSDQKGFLRMPLHIRFTFCLQFCKLSENLEVLIKLKVAAFKGLLQNICFTWSYHCCVLWFFRGISKMLSILIFSL